MQSDKGELTDTKWVFVWVFLTGRHTSKKQRKEDGGGGGGGQL